MEKTKFGRGYLNVPLKAVWQRWRWRFILVKERKKGSRNVWVNRLLAKVVWERKPKWHPFKITPQRMSSQPPRSPLGEDFSANINTNFLGWCASSLRTSSSVHWSIAAWLRDGDFYRSSKWGDRSLLSLKYVDLNSSFPWLGRFGMPVFDISTAIGNVIQHAAIENWLP